MKKNLFIFIFLILIQACHTVRLVNDKSEMSPRETDWAWNHTGVFGIVNYSDDFYVNRLCPKGQWQYVETSRNKWPLAAELSVGALASVMFASKSSAGVALVYAADFLWDPLYVGWGCD